MVKSKEFQPTQYHYRLIGESPLIIHWDNVEWADQIAAERTRIKEGQGKLKAGDDRVPAFTWKGYTYNDGENVAIPTDNLRTMLMKAAARITLDGKKTFKELSQCGMLFDDLYTTFTNNGKQITWGDIDAIDGDFATHSEAAKNLGFRLLVKRVVVGQSKHIRVRPIFDKWEIEGTFTVINEQVTPKILDRMWDIAGVYIGLCEWRPGAPKSPGPYGRFSAELKVV